jgi:PAS domain S-box-containing protein
LIAGKLGQATTNIRSGNLGPVWPASGIALAGLLAFGVRAWPGIIAGSFLVAFQSPVPALTALGQSAGATLAAVSGALLVRRGASFDPALSRLRDALALIVLGAFASATLSATIGLASLYATRVVPYDGLTEAWVIYWLGDATGVLLITPLVFTLATLFSIRSRRRVVELTTLLTLLTAACFLVFGDLPLFPIRLHVLAFAVLPFVMWAAIDFGIGGASLSVFLIATVATLQTAVGSGPFSANTPFINAALLDVLFVVLAVSGLTLAAVIAERERAEAEREKLIRKQAALETRLHLAAIVDSSNDAILSTTLEGIILSWNAAAQRIFGFTEGEVVGQPITMLVPPARWEEDVEMLARLRAGEEIAPYESMRVTKTHEHLNVAVTISPLRNADGELIGAARILRDITEQKRAEEALSTLGRSLIDAQEQERGRIARELHDDIGQRLALLSVNLTGLTEIDPVRPSSDGQLTDIQRQASEIASDVQALSHRLHSSRLELLGITAAMSHFCEEFAAQQHAAVDFSTHHVPERMPQDVSLCLFRILQEALHNSFKHSGVERFEVNLWGAHGDIHLVVRDQGKGFQTETARTGRGIGLVSMEERIKLVKGTLSIQSEPQGGTTIHARVPLGSSEAAPVR